LVNYSIKAQDFILKKAIKTHRTIDAHQRTMDSHRNEDTADVDEVNIEIGDENANLDSFLDDSIVGPKTTTNKRNKPIFFQAGGSGTPSHGLLNLPQIEKKKSPFKGFLDTSLIT